MATINEIIIGRAVPKKPDTFRTPEEYKVVSATHAKIFRNEEGKICIQDLDSSNGTFVNGKRVEVSPVTSSDEIILGRGEGYKLNLSEILAMLPLSDSEFDRLMNKLKDIYENHLKESDRLNGIKEKLMTLRILPASISAAATGIVTFLSNDPEVQKLAGKIGGVVTAILMGIAIFVASKISKRIRATQQHLTEQYQIDYVCPNCHNSLQGKTWAYIKNLKSCPICHRKFTAK